MFLLIRKSDRDQKRDRISLNSIMFLLIPQCKLCTVRAVLALNSIMFLLIQLTGTQKRIQKINFKFHYVSINSKLKSILTGEQAALNSIMFLLIRNKSRQNSWGLTSFKFHYVSINSRPKTNCLFTPRNTFILSTSSKYIISFSLFIICFSNTSYFSHFLLLSIPCVFYTITGRQKSLYFYHIKFFISLTLPIMNPINQICNPNIQIHI